MRLSASVKHVFICEKHEEKRTFLHQQFRPSMSFGDVADIAQQQATDLLSGLRVFVPWVCIFWAGFSCKSRTRLSSKSSQHLNCLQRHDNEAETSYTFDKVYAYILRVKPLLIILENVVGLLQKASADALSDAEYVIEFLQEAGYVVKLMKFDSEDFGSKASRMRLYFLGWVVMPRGGSVDSESSGFQEATARLGFLDKLLDRFVIGSLPCSMFLTLDLASAEQHHELLLTPDVSNKVAKKDLEWQNEHLQAFRSKGFQWPLDLHDLELNDNNMIFKRWTLGARPAELLVFCHWSFEFRIGEEEDNDEVHVEFIDVNPSMGRLLQHGGSPWKSTCPTLTGGAIICVRYMLKGVLILRPLTAIEYFELMGWHVSMFREKPVKCLPDIMSNMAGNAFSAFAFQPALMLSFSGLGMLTDLAPNAFKKAGTVEGLEEALTPTELEPAGSDLDLSQSSGSSV